MKAALVLVALAAATSMSACATLTRGTTQQFTVESTPSGAAVRTSHGFTCPATPCTFSLQRKEAFTATVSMDGYVTQTASVTSQMAGDGAAGMAGNVLIGGLIGIGVDATSGAMNDLSPNPLIVVLEPVPAPPAVPAVAANEAPLGSEPAS